ncbi:TIGR01777 family oxidoreductase [Bacillus inaquosorum]|uniref:TIGR01777 family oxidoreductase n=1 Tax=Bacillus inaquosorum TaxID=483913 RepID=UPI0022811D03|nr:TIGR01777 family oxidoreductase [Bacillus inaquosorum]MCY7758868.1 TIGR01777 family oxidoreductase [Bacillus inaquosorum]MCY7980951.1 TIGR01777 family oxidoreductase [Bacillus inaquosorum]MCY8277903.1 TIGR01777 family oxidoreductase [Bacillus inaquosorum]MCY8730956.1 TIGR01777 family oxidoreductase [Bacillus inaquosorum]MCY8753757.1 TIGR01777 family oxidoreductase [Bacillus inaquosorum]
MNIAMTGGTGFLGQHLTGILTRQGHHVYILSRNARETEQKNITYVQWLTEGSAPEQELPHIDVWVNLAGKSIFGRWTEKTKQQILSSRINATREVQRLIQKQKEKPKALIQASAVGIYGTSLEKTFTEDSATSDEDFLSHTAHMWEKEGQKIEAMGIRTVYARFGVMLGEKGALPLMVLPYKLLAGGTIGTGRQWLSWIHVEDAAQLICYAMENAGISGPMNVTAPNPVEMEQFGKTIARVKHRPHWLPVPEFFLSKALGEMSLLIVKGQRALPKKAMTSGFRFTYSDLEFALSQLITDRKAV